jgi:hypothetical protein
MSDFVRSLLMFRSCPGESIKVGYFFAFEKIKLGYYHIPATHRTLFLH